MADTKKEQEWDGLNSASENDDSKEFDSRKADSVIRIMQPPEVVAIEVKMKTTDPVCDGLYPHEILVLSYAKKFYTTDNNFQGFWWYEYGISDVQKILDSLVGRGYIQIKDISDAIKLETVPSIKEELKKRDLKAGGKKGDLIQRLIENVPEEELSQRFSKCPYKLTILGEDTLKKYEWIPYIHAHKLFEGLDIWNLTDMVTKSPGMNYRDIIWNHLNDRKLMHFKNDSFGLYRNCLFEMSEFIAEENRWEESFNLLCEVSDYDLSGLYNGCDLNRLAKEAALRYFPYDNSFAKMGPGILWRIANCQSRLGWNETELKDRMIEQFSSISLPFRIFTEEECAEIILYEMRKDTEGLEKIYDVAKERLIGNAD